MTKPIKVSIHFKENGIPSVIRGELTEESKQQIEDFYRNKILEAEKRGFDRAVRIYRNDSPTTYGAGV